LTELLLLLGSEEAGGSVNGAAVVESVELLVAVVVCVGVAADEVTALVDPELGVDEVRLFLAACVDDLLPEAAAGVTVV